ncbi:MAG TPA: hypothetical protein VIY48_13615 [Candidatus Paceibacterota bacterium]
MNTQELLEQLTEAYANRDLLAIDKARAVPEEVKKILADIDAEYAPKMETVNATISDLEAKVKSAVIESGATAKGGALQAVFTKGRVTWDTKQLDGLMIAVPQLAQARKEGQPSVSIRKVG